MTDLELAETRLKNGGFSVVVAKAGEVLGKGSGPMVKPLLQISEELGSDLKESSVADKVVGKAAALLLRYYDVAEVYAEIISEPAVEVLKPHVDKLCYDELVLTILNRDETAPCPLEKLVSEIEDPELARQRILQFFN